jgi:hypothetical protein
MSVVRIVASGQGTVLLQRRRAPIVLTKLGTSFTRSLRSCLGRKGRSIEALATPTTASSNSGEVTLMVVAAKMANTPSPLFMWLSERVEKVEETMVELCAG